MEAEVFYKELADDRAKAMARLAWWLGRQELKLRSPMSGLLVVLLVVMK